MRTKHYIDMPARMNDLWEWVVALDSWDYCDPDSLSELLFKEQTIPPEFLRAVADIVSGKRKPKRRAAVKLKIPARERMKIAGSISLVLGLVDALKFDAIYPEGKGSSGIGSEHGREPNEVLRELESEQRKAIESASKNLNVSQETIENLLRDFRRKIENWPTV
jgi:hypothetical protein